MDWEITYTPDGDCTACGNHPVDETKPNRPPLPMVWATGLDINWGESLLLCMNCAGVISDLLDRPSRELVTKLKDELKLARKQRDKANEKLQAQQTKIDRILSGAKAKKELKEAQ
jgi:hypothetical protein